MKHRHNHRAAAVLVFVLAAWLVPAAAAAQDVPCGNTGGVPCGYGISELKLQKVPPILRFQARVSQAKVPQGRGVVSSVVVKVLRGTEVLCTEEITQVEVERSVLNLEIGRNISCELDDVIAENDSLAFQVCLGGADSCLKPIEWSSASLAVKATYAQYAQQAGSAKVAAQANYAHRATADQDLFNRTRLGAGYFDFYTPPADAAQDLYSAEDYAAQQGGGMVQWTPVRTPTDRSLFMGARNHVSSEVESLDTLVFGATETLARGDVTVDSLPTGEGLVVASRGMRVTGDSDVAGDLYVSASAWVQGGNLHVGQSAVFDGEVTVGKGVTVTPGGLTLQGDAEFRGTTEAQDAMSAGAAMLVSGDSDVATMCTTPQMLVQGNLRGPTTPPNALFVALSVGGESTVDGAATTGLLDTGPAAISQLLSVGGNLDVYGPATLAGAVSFSTAPDVQQANPDQRYVRGDSPEARSITFEGDPDLGVDSANLYAGALLGGALRLDGNPLTNMRFEVSAGPPEVCAAAATMVYEEQLDGSLRTDEPSPFFLFPPKNLGDSSYWQVWYSPVRGNVERIAVYSTTGPFVAETLDVGNGQVFFNIPFDAVAGYPQPFDLFGPNDPGTWVEAVLPASQPVYPGENFYFYFTAGSLPTLKVSLSDVYVGGSNTNFGEDYVFRVGIVPDVCAPAECNTANEGLFFVDSTRNALRVCINGQYQDLGPAGSCGDGAVNRGEQCDDSNNASNDGCFACRVEQGFTCRPGAPTVCTSNCGDGLRVGQEGCDDGRRDNGDGCSASCAVEVGWSCTAGNPSTCTPVCGDGLKRGGELCDDGNTTPGDGCSATCTVEAPEGAVRLVAVGNRQRLEIHHVGAWGTVNATGFDMTDANVACRQLGRAGALSFSTPRQSNVASAIGGPIWLSRVGCRGGESTLASCSATWGPFTSLSHSDDVLLECLPAGEGQLRIVGGSNRTDGRLEIYRAGEWGTVCDDYFDNVDATVACRQMGYSVGYVRSNLWFGLALWAGTGPIWLDNVECTGSETTLASCPAQPWGVHNCVHREDVRIDCD